MGTHSTPHLHVELDRVLDDDSVADDTIEAVGLPDRLDRTLEVPEADAIDQKLDVPVDIDEHR